MGCGVHLRGGGLAIPNECSHPDHHCDAQHEPYDQGHDGSGVFGFGQRRDELVRVEGFRVRNTLGNSWKQVV